MNVKGAVLAVMGKPQIYFANMGHGEAIQNILRIVEKCQV